MQDKIKAILNKYKILVVFLLLASCCVVNENTKKYVPSQAYTAEPQITVVHIVKETQVVTQLVVVPEGVTHTPSEISTKTPTVKVGAVDYDNTIDVERTYILVSALMGREPTVREVLYMTIWNEYWLVQIGSTIGQEAVARSYYHFCGIDGCTQKEFFIFLTSYEPWFGKSGSIDNNLAYRANNLYKMLINELNYKNSGELLYSQIDEILDIEFATEMGWTNGKENNKPSQWLGACSNKEKGTYGYEKSDYAIIRISAPGYYFSDGVTKAYFYFFTHAQSVRNNGFCDVPK